MYFIVSYSILTPRLAFRFDASVVVGGGVVVVVGGGGGVGGGVVVVVFFVDARDLRFSY